MTKKKLPPWFKQRIAPKASVSRVTSILEKLNLNTVCESARCPNLGKCYSAGTATFMILGNVCTRNCRYCAVIKGKPPKLDPEEPSRVARAVRELELDYVVITSVTRDDLPDGGAEHFARTIEKIKRSNPATEVEALIPDFQGNPVSIQWVAEALPRVINHNLEVVPRLYPEARQEANYQGSLELLKKIKLFNPLISTKSGLMLGLGETENEMLSVFDDLRGVDCDILTLGQYLQPSAEHLEVKEYIHPEQFQRYKEKARAKGFKSVVSEPLARSSYQAKEASRWV